MLDSKDRKEAVTAMMEAILSAFYATVQEEDDQFRDSQVFAEAALAGLESAGFKVIRDAHRA